MGWEGWFTLAIVLLALIAMMRELASPDLVMMAALFAITSAGILTPVETFLGFANPALAAIGALFVVSAGLRETGALEMTVGRLLDRARSEGAGLARICTPVATLSAFLNNAPIVAMMTPTIIDWSRRRGVSPSRFLIPLSYSSILGSATTVIGTSTILTVAGLMIDAGMVKMGFFELAPVGLPVAIVGIAYLQFVGPRLLPVRQQPSEHLGEHRREYTASMIVAPECPLIGQTVEEAGLRHLPGLFLVEIDRVGRIITPVAPDNIIRDGDRLVFAGVVSTIVELQRIRGLVPATEDESAAPSEDSHRLLEAVVSTSSPLVGQSIRESNFRTMYDAAIIAVHRNGATVPGKIGVIVLEAGDTLLMQGAPGSCARTATAPTSTW